VSFLSADHGKLSSERPPNISVESLKLNGLDKEVVFSRRWVDILRIMLDSYSNIYFGWSLFTGDLCPEVIYTEVTTNQKYPTYYPPFQSTESRHPCRDLMVTILSSLSYCIDIVKH